MKRTKKGRLLILKKDANRKCVNTSCWRVRTIAKRFNGTVFVSDRQGSV